MATNDDDRGAKASRAVSNTSHPAGGGHNRITPSRGPAVATARGNQAFWDCTDSGTGGDDTPYVFQEYPKRVTVDGVDHHCVSADHEAALTGQTSETP